MDMAVILVREFDIPCLWERVEKRSFILRSIRVWELQSFTLRCHQKKILPRVPLRSKFNCHPIKDDLGK